MRGMFVVLDGIDGSGTTTQATRLADHFRSQGYEVVLTREPSTGPVGVLIRQQLSAEPGVDETTLALLFAADRVDHVTREVKPALERGALVICDRYILSSLAYQALRHPQAWIAEINGMGRVLSGYYLPADVTFFFDIDPKVAHQRVQARAGVVERFDALVLQHQIAEHYKTAMRFVSDETVVRIDAAKPIEEITAELIASVQKALAY